jgi:ABC-type transport system involved in multi-copper enzyme maturation permease subunit
VRRFATLVGLALRELWISYRLLTVLGVLLVATLPAALLPELPQPVVTGLTLERPAWYAAGLATGLALAAGIAAATLAGELRRGTLGWLAVRAVPRTTLLLAWFVAFALVLAVGLAASAALAAMSLGEAFLAGRLGAFVVVSAGVAASGLAAMACGLLLGTLLRPAVAALVTSSIVVGLLLATAFGSPDGSPLPAAGLAILASFDEAARPIGEALRSSGTALAIAAGLLVLAAARLERLDL